MNSRCNCIRKLEEGDERVLQELTCYQSLHVMFQKLRDEDIFLCINIIEMKASFVTT